MNLVAVVVNPTKFDDPAPVRDELTQLAREHGAELLWLETTAEDPGGSQTREALAKGADLICALGGDGTVRAVATELAGGDVPLGLLPGGTGNLLARNLHNPIDSIGEAFTAALDGVTERIDVGWVSRDGGPEEAFLVMSGLGMDAETMADTSEEVKAKVGWVAYAATGVKKLVGKGFSVRVHGDGGSDSATRARSVLVGNCGMIQGDMELSPKARLDDGILDLVVFEPDGLLGYLAAATRVVLRRRSSEGAIRDLAGARFEVTTHHPVEAQIDGDAIGTARRLSFRVDQRALPVRTHEGGSRGE